MTEQQTEKWVAWTDEDPERRVEFEVPLGSTYDVSDAGATALGIELSESVNVARAD